MEFEPQTSWHDIRRVNHCAIKQIPVFGIYCWRVGALLWWLGVRAPVRTCPKKVLESVFYQESVIPNVTWRILPVEQAILTHFANTWRHRRISVIQSCNFHHEFVIVLSHGLRFGRLIMLRRWRFKIFNSQLSTITIWWKSSQNTYASNQCGLRYRETCELILEHTNHVAQVCLHHIPDRVMLDFPLHLISDRRHMSEIIFSAT